MKVKDIFKEVFVGVNLSNYSKKKDLQQVYTFKKDNINYNSILYNDYGYSKFKNKKQYKSISNNDIFKLDVSKSISDNFFIKYGDIVISVKKPYKVFNDIIVKKEKMLVTNNYVVLRGISEDFYAPYVSYYLENRGIKKYLDNNSKANNELTKEDIKNIEIPNISKKEQIDRYFKIETRINKILEYQDQIEEILDKE